MFERIMEDPRVRLFLKIKKRNIYEALALAAASSARMRSISKSSSDTVAS
jgi:hypothetical protein